MSAKEIANALFSGISQGVKNAMDNVQALAPGLKDAGPEMKAEMSRLGTQGAMELAQALFDGAAFTPYGPGQYTPSPDQSPDHGLGNKGMEQPKHQQERGGMSM